MGLFSKIAFAGLILSFLGIRIIFGLIAQRSGLSFNFENNTINTGEKKTPGVLGIIIFIIILLAFLFFILMPYEKNILILALPEWALMIGLGIGILGLALQMVVHKILQEVWALEKSGGKKESLIRNGPFQWVRHPLYSSLILFLAGLSLATAYLPFIILTVGSVPFFNNEAKKEEKELLIKFGKEYEEYRKNTGQLFPRVRV